MADPIILSALAGLLGLAIGSFLNVVIHRLPIMMERAWQRECAELNNQEAAPQQPLSLLAPRSRCPHCERPIRAVENIPLLSYLLLRGRCKGCGQAISLRYPLVEVACALLFALATWRFGSGWAAGGALVFVAVMLTLSMIDFDTQLLPDDITLPFLWLGLLLNLGQTYTSLSSAVIGAACGYLALWSVYWLFKLLTGKEGMGYGDFKLLAAIGAWLGWQMLPLVILASSILGATVGIALIVFGGQGRNVPIPFGPYLAGAGCIALFWGPAINHSYLGLFLA